MEPSTPQTHGAQAHAQAHAPAHAQAHAQAYTPMQSNLGVALAAASESPAPVVAGASTPTATGPSAGSEGRSPVAPGAPRRDGAKARLHGAGGRCLF